MNAPTFDAQHPICPICHRPTLIRSPKLLTGLLTCQQCRERLVVSWSGHYVRDPFNIKPLSTERMLRRESHPFYRILRDLGITRFHVMLMILAGTLAFGVFSGLFEKASPDNPATPPAVSWNAPKDELEEG